MGKRSPFGPIERKSYQFDWKLVAAALLAQTDIEEGHWEPRLVTKQVHVVGAQINNAGAAYPTVMHMFDRIELVRVKQPTAASVDAATIFTQIAAPEDGAAVPVPGPVAKQ